MVRRADLSRPVNAGRRFDLAVCVEVAEHLPHDSANVLIQSLCDLSDVVLFSAAVPLQGGTNHVNEQWPTYWAQRFAIHDYACFDYFRPMLWSDEDIEYFYRQNVLLFIREGATSNYAEDLTKTVESSHVTQPLALVHPVKYLELATFANVDSRLLLRRLPGIAASVSRRRVARTFTRWTR